MEKHVYTLLIQICSLQYSVCYYQEEAHMNLDKRV